MPQKKKETGGISPSNEKPVKKGQNVDYIGIKPDGTGFMDIDPRLELWRLEEEAARRQRKWLHR